MLFFFFEMKKQEVIRLEDSAICGLEFAESLCGRGESWAGYIYQFHYLDGQI
jgi:hypothetical protein